MEKIRICVTGSHGFLGSALLAELYKKKDIEIIEFDDDIQDKIAIELFFKNHPNIDQCIHLAGIKINTPDIFNINTEGTRNILDACIKYGVKKIIFSSTGAVYGGSITHNSKEDDPLNPVDDYGKSKKLAEEIIQKYSKNKKIKYIILRFSNIYGPSGQSVVNKFFNNAKNNKPVELSGNGEQKRKFLFINDAVSAIIKSIYYPQNTILNIAGERTYSLKDLIDLIMTKYPGLKIINTKEHNKLRVLSENINKARKILIWEPKVRLEQGIERL